MTIDLSFFYFYFYSFLRLLSTKRLIPFVGNKSSGKPHKPDLFEELLLGFIAGVASRAISTPLNLVTLKMQTEREDSDVKPTKAPQPAGVIDALKLIYKEHGLIGFWRGFQMSALLSLNPSITLACFQVYRRVLEVLKTTSPRKAIRVVQQKGLSNSIKNSPSPTANPNPREAFFGAATSNTIAVSILYPLILGKKRLQASEKNATMTEILVDAYLGKDIAQEKQDVAIEPSIEGLYQGWSVKVIVGFLSQGVTFLVKSRYVDICFLRATPEFDYVSRIEQLVIAAYLLRLRRGKTSP